MHVSSLEGGQEVKDKEMWSKKKREREGGGCTQCVRSDDLDAIRMRDNVCWGWGCTEVDRGNGIS